MTSVYVGDVGTVFLLDTGVNVSSATVKEIRVKKRGKYLKTWSPVTVADLTKLRYVAVFGDLDMAGEYALQAYVEMPSWKGHGNTVTVTVLPLA